MGIKTASNNNTIFLAPADMIKVGTRISVPLHNIGPNVSSPQRVWHCSRVFVFLTIPASRFTLRVLLYIPTIPRAHTRNSTRCRYHSSLCYGSRSSVVILFSVFLQWKMVQHIKEVITEYEERLRRSSYVRRFSYGRVMLRDDGAPNRLPFPHVPFEWRINGDSVSSSASSSSSSSSSSSNSSSILTISGLGLVSVFFSNLSPY